MTSMPLHYLALIRDDVALRLTDLVGELAPIR